MFAKIAILGLSAKAQTDQVGVSSTMPQIETTLSVTDQIGSASVTGTTGTGSIYATGSTAGATNVTVATFDPSQSLINVDLGNCSIGKLSSLDTMNLFESVKELINETCKTSSTLFAVEEEEGLCHVRLMVEVATDYDYIQQCLIAPIELNYLETIYPVSIASVPTSPIVFSPLTVGDIRDRLEAGLASDLMNDSVVGRVPTKMKYGVIADAVDEALTYLNNIVNKIEDILDRQNPDIVNSLEVVAIEEDASGMAVLVLRPVAVDLATEASTLQSLKSQIADQSSELNLLLSETMNTTSTVPSDTTMPVMTTDMIRDSTTSVEGGSDAGLIGGLIGGIAGVAAIGGGIAVWRKNKKKRDKDEPIVQNASSPVMTPNTTHAVNGILTERTPRNAA